MDLLQGSLSLYLWLSPDKARYKELAYIVPLFAVGDDEKHFLVTSKMKLGVKIYDSFI